MDEAPALDVGRYLDRIGFTGDVSIDLATLAALQRAHLTTVPFENLDVFHGEGVRTDLAWSVDKVVNRRRGGWCFEANGAFSALLQALGFPLARLGAAVLLGGPNETIDHLTLEVTLDEPYLVDVGFGDGFITPLRLNTAGPQDGGNGTYELIDSAQGRTLTRWKDGVPEAQYRFRRVNRAMADFEPASQYLQGNRELRWSTKPFATRLLDGGPERVTLLADRLEVTGAGDVTETPVSSEDWDDVLDEWFGMRPTR